MKGLVAGHTYELANFENKGCRRPKITIYT